MGLKIEKNKVKKEIVKIENEILVLTLFLNIFTTENNIKAITQDLIPIKAEPTISVLKYGSKKSTMKVIMEKDGKITPKDAIIDPRTPDILLPTKVAKLIAIGPGVICVTESISKNSSPLIHLFFCTISVSISGIIAYPPPKVKSPILKNVINSLNTIAHLQFFKFYHRGRLKIKCFMVVVYKWKL
jgi:hypothetical protein